MNAMQGGLMLLGLLAVTLGTRAIHNAEKLGADENVAFFAHTRYPMYENEEDLIIDYRSVPTNVGNAYVPSVGHFVAPYAGHYRFFWSNNGYPQTKVALYRNLEPVVGSYLKDTSGHTGNSAIVYLLPEDQVFLVLKAGSQILSSGSFSGYKLDDGFSAFSVSRGEAFGVNGLDAPILYDNISVNVGGDYKYLSGSYMAPQHGVYMFQWSVCSNSASYSSHTVLYRNDVPLVGAREDQGQEISSVGNTVLLELQAQDIIQTKLLAGGRIDNAGSEMNTQTNVFNGHLLFNMSASKVAFCAVRTSSFSQLGTILYDSVLVNTHNAYNPLSGFFTAPHSATYQFNWCGGGQSSNSAPIMELYLNRVYIVRTYGSQSSEATACNPAILTLNVGDLVDIRHSGGPLFSSADGKNTFATFCGHMLFE